MSTEIHERRSILVVDDEASLAAVIKEVLCDAGYDVVDVPSAEEGLDLLGGRRFDLVWTDLKLPGMHGIDLIERARRLHPSLAVVLTTAYADEAALARARQAGVARVLRKPLRAREICRHVAEVLAQGPACIAAALPRTAAGDTPLLPEVRSAEGGLLVCGDSDTAFCDVYPTRPSASAVLIGLSPRGEPLPAALRERIRGAFRAEAARHRDPARALGSLNRLIYEEGDASRRAACVCLARGRNRGEARWASSGPCAAVLRLSGCRIEPAAVSLDLPWLGLFPDCWPDSGLVAAEGADEWVAWLADAPLTAPPDAAALATSPVASLADACRLAFEALPGSYGRAAFGFRLTPRPPVEEKIEFGGCADTFPRATKWLEAFAEHSGLDPLARYEMVSAGIEAVMNACLHAYASDGGRIRLRAWRAAGEVVLEVTDWGRGTDVAAPEHTSDDWFRPSGRGIGLMRSLTDRLAVVSRPGRGTRVVMAKKLPPRT